MTLSKSKLTLLIISTVILGCSPKSSIYLNDNFEKNGSSSSFAVLPLNQDWTPDAAKKRMYTQELDYFFQALNPSFSSNTPNRVNVIKSELNLTESDFVKRNLGSEKISPLEVNYPSEILTNSVEDRFVYFLEGYKFQLVQKAGDRVSFAYQDAAPQLALQFETEFYLFDKSNSEIIAWGTVKDDTDVFGRPKFADYLTVLTKASKKIMIDSPFQVYRN